MLQHRISTSRINFYARNDIITRFDLLVALSGRTRTDVLNELMEEFILSRTALLQERQNRLLAVDEMLSSFSPDNHQINPPGAEGVVDDDDVFRNANWSDGTDYWESVDYK